MKIVFIITRSDAIGGAQIHVRDLSLHLKEKGYDPVVFVGGEGAFVNSLIEKGIPVRSISKLVRPVHPVRDLEALIQLRRELMIVKPDLVSIHSSKAGLLGRLAAKSLDIPVVFTAHGWAFTEGVAEKWRKLYVKVEKWAERFSDKIITVSDYDRQLALD